MAFPVKNKKPLLMTISQNGLRVLGGSLNLWAVFPKDLFNPISPDRVQGNIWKFLALVTILQTDLVGKGRKLSNKKT